MIAGDIGTTLELTLKKSDGTVYDLSAASTKEIVLQAPSGVSTTKTASFVTDGTNGKIKWVTVANDIDEVGLWKVRAHIVTASFDRRSIWASFSVGE